MVEKGDVIVGSLLILFIIGIFYTSHLMGVRWDHNMKQQRGFEDKCKSYPIDKELIGETYFGYTYSYTNQYFCERIYINGSTTEYTYVEKGQTDPYCNRGISVCD